MIAMKLVQTNICGCFYSKLANAKNPVRYYLLLLLLLLRRRPRYLSTTHSRGPTPTASQPNFVTINCNLVAAAL